MTENLNFEIPVSFFKNLKELSLRRNEQANAKFELSTNSVEAIRQVDWCIGDLGFISRAKDMLLERKCIRSLLQHSERRFIVKETIDIGGPWELLNEETKDNLVRDVLPSFYTHTMLIHYLHRPSHMTSMLSKSFGESQ